MATSSPVACNGRAVNKVKKDTADLRREPLNDKSVCRNRIRGIMRDDNKEHRRMRKVILYLAANPYDTATLPELSKELKEVKREIRQSKFGREFDFQPVYAASPKDLRTEVMELRPQIVHFSGHGDGVNGIILETDACTRDSNPVTGEMLEDFFGHFDFVECVVLNACYSTVQAELLQRCVNYVIGIDERIDDESGREFSASFYNALGNGYSIESAFGMSRSYLNMKRLPVECQPRLFKREAPQPQVDTGEQKATLSVFDPFKEVGTFVGRLLTKRRHESSSLRTDANSDTQTLMFQWIAVCMVALLLAAGISTGPADSLLSTLRLIAVLAVPLLQWMVLKYWMRNVSAWKWFLGTVFGSLCGWWLGEAVSNLVIDNFLHLSYWSSADLACWYAECGSSYIDSALPTAINLVISSLVVGGTVGAIQGWLLRRSFLRVSLRKWVLASTTGLTFGSLLGRLAIWYDASFASKNPDDFMFALFLGAVYGFVTGRVLLSYADAPAAAKPAISSAPIQQSTYKQPEGEFRSLASSVAVPAQILGSTGRDLVEEAKRGLAFHLSSLAIQTLRWLDTQHTTPRVANWSLAFAMLAVYFTFSHPLLFAMLSALTSVYCVRQVALHSAENPPSEGKKRAKVARFLSYAVLLASLFRAMFT